jgi:hypothetical protein
MSQLRSVATAALLIQFFFASQGLAVAQNAAHSRTPVVVELFTSEGCSSCPPADALLAKLDHDQPFDGAEIIVLGEHVDYWDGQGWHDRFSSAQFTQRQKEYASHLNISDVYTPQMIVDGTAQFVGNDGAHAQSSILRAEETPKLNLVLTQAVVNGHRVSASLSSSSPAPSDKIKGDIYVALIDPTDTTEIRGGENRGVTLQHAGVVRTLQRVGSLKQLTSGPLSFNVTAPSDANPSQMRLVAFVQQSGPGAILGAVSKPVTP